MTDRDPEKQEARRPDDLMREARLAAERRDPARMIEALTASGFLDGLVRRLEAKWGRRLPRSEIEDGVARAVDSVYDALTTGRQVRDLGAWLWKAADNIADDCWRIDYRLRTEVAGELPEKADETISQAERVQRDALAEHRRAEAVRWARQLLPRIGQGQVVAVMEMVIDAVEKGIPDLPSMVIAESLGISNDAARTLLSRGLDRLKREAGREGIEFPNDLPTTDTGEDDGYASSTSDLDDGDER